MLATYVADARMIWKLKFLSSDLIWYIYTNLPVSAIVRLPHPRSGDSQGQETFLSPSADKQTRNYDIECSNTIPPYQP